MPARHLIEIMENMSVFEKDFRKASIFVGLAFIWSMVTLILLLRYHIDEPLGTTSVSLNGHNYFGNPPALTLLQRDPVSFTIVVGVLIAGLLISVSDLVLRILFHAERRGKTALVTGSSMVVFSLFGLVWGLASVGIVGLLIFFSAFPNHD